MTLMNLRIQFLLAAALGLSSHAAHADPPDISGTFHLLLKTATDADVPVIGTTRVNTSSDLLATIVRKNGQYIQSHKTCTVNAVPTRGFGKTLLPQRFVDTLPVKTYPLVLTQSPDGWSFDADLQPQSVGYHPEKSGGVMPTTEDHPAIYDWDSDGKPGASIIVQVPLFGEFRIYMLQYSHARLSGTVLSPDKITGEAIMMKLGQKTIGADHFVFKTSAKIRPAPQPQPFVMTRVPDGSTCADLK